MNNRLSKRLELDYSDVMVAVFELMMWGGARAKDLLPVCINSLKRAESKSRLNHKKNCGGLIIAALVLDAWHRERRYLNKKGLPNPIRLIGPAPSVEALIRLQKVKESAGKLAYRLKAMRLIVPCGRGLYKPAGDAAVISERDPFVLQHVARGLSSLLETVGQNVSSGRNLPPLIERCAEVPDLPRKHIRAFQTFTQAQGRIFLRTVNDWLESRRVRPSARRGATGTVRAGIHTYAYVAPIRRRETSLPSGSV